jgi:hypothetical protein
MMLYALAWLLIVLAVADLAITVFLVTRNVKEPAYQERATVSVILTFAAVLWAILGAAYLLDISLVSPTGTALLFGGLLLISAPQVIWFVAYWRGVFK